MLWSRIKKQFESLVAPSLRGRLQVHLTEYTKRSPHDVGRGWITIDGNEVVSIQIPSFYSNNICFGTNTLDFGRAIGEYLKMPIEEARSSKDELIQGLVFLDRRLGKRTLKSIDEKKLDEFARLLFRVRREADTLSANNAMDSDTVRSALRVPRGARHRGR